MVSLLRGQPSMNIFTPIKDHPALQATPYALSSSAPQQPFLLTPDEDKIGGYREVLENRFY